MGNSEPWKDADRLRRLYHEAELTTYEIADELGCSQPNIRYWMEKLGIERRKAPSQKHRENQAPWKDVAVLERMYVEEEQSIPDISDELGCAETTIWDWLDRHDIERRQPGRAPTPEKLEDEEVLRRLYVAEGLSSLEIADEIGCDKSTVLDWLYRHKIPVRERHAPRQVRDREALETLYVDEKKTMEEIAERLGCGRTTIATWLEKHDINTRPSAAHLRGKDSPHWKKGAGSEYDYGTNWPEISERVRKRDGEECVRCGIANEEHVKRYGRTLPVHHNIPVREFVVDGELRESEAHRITNLVTVCVVCHGLLEGIPLDLRHRDWKDSPTESNG